MVPTFVVCALVLAPRLDADGVPLPPEALRRVGSALWRYPAPLGQPVVSTDGRRVYTPAGDFRVVAWDAATGRQLDAFHLPPVGRFAQPKYKEKDKLHDGFLEFDPLEHRRLDPLPDGRLRVIDSPYGDLCVRTIDPITRRVQTELTAALPLWHAAELSHDYRWAAGMVLDTAWLNSINPGRDFLKVYDTRTRQVAYRVPITKVESPTDWGSFYFSPDDRWLAVADGESFRLLDPATGELRRLLTKETVAEFQFSPDCKTVAGLVRGFIYIDHVAVWDTATGRQLYQVKLPIMRRGNSEPAYQLAYRPDVNRLAVLKNRVGVRFLDATTGATVAEVSDQTYLRGAFSLSGERFFAATRLDDDYGAVYAMDLTATPPRVHRSSVSHVTLAYPTNRELLFAHSTELIRFDPTTGATRAERFALPAKYGLVFPTLSSDGRWVTANLEDVNREEKTVAAIDLATGVARYLPADATTAVDWWQVPPGGKTVVGIDRGELATWNPATNKVTTQPLVSNKGGDELTRGWLQTEYRPWVVTSTNAYNRKALAIGRIEITKPGPLSLYDLHNLSAPRWQFTPTSGDCRDCFVMRDGRGVLLRMNQGTATALEFWDGPTGRRLWRRTDLPSSIDAQSPDGRTLATSPGPDVVLLETATGRVRHTFRGHRADVRAACFSPDGRTLAVASPDAPVLLWDVAGELSRGGSPPDPNAAWADLASLDATVAFHAVRRLAWFPDQTLAMLRAKLPPAAAVEEKTVARLIAGLDAPAFADREAAVAGLKALGDLARPGLEVELKRTASAEVRARIESLLDPSAWVAQNGDYLRTIRAAEVVERIGTPAARDLLTRWADGATGARLTREAKESLDRLVKSPGK